MTYNADTDIDAHNMLLLMLQTYIPILIHKMSYLCVVVNIALQKDDCIRTFLIRTKEMNHQIFHGKTGNGKSIANIFM